MKGSPFSCIEGNLWYNNRVGEKQEEKFMWKIIIISLLVTIVNYLLITTIIDIVLMGKFSVRFARKSIPSSYMLTDENRTRVSERNKSFACVLWNQSGVLCRNNRCFKRSTL